MAPPDGVCSSIITHLPKTHTLSLSYGNGHADGVRTAQSRNLGPPLMTYLCKSNKDSQGVKLCNSNVYRGDEYQSGEPERLD